jgi:hypothetical protein
MNISPNARESAQHSIQAVGFGRELIRSFEACS